MHKFQTLAAFLIAVPLAAQTSPPVDRSRMQGVDQDNTAGMNHGAQAKAGEAKPAGDHDKMGSMSHSKMSGMGEMLTKNTPANPYAEVGMAMHHKMMIVGADASETWVRQMVEHHRGAIDMSKIAVAQASDKEVKTMAQKVVTMQEKEVANLQSWLQRQGKKVQ